MEDSYSGAIDAAVQAISDLSALTPRIAMVLGSGLGALADQVLTGDHIPYSEIPGFPHSTAPGHAGKLVLGAFEGRPVVIMAGRVHLYEGYAAKEVVFGVRVMRALGADTLLITNAAGGVNLEFEQGVLMLISDHINLTGQNPLAGRNDPHIGVRFPDMSDVYTPELRALARDVAGELHVTVAEGVYLGLTGPSYETPAEIRMARVIGADAVGMSTVMEVIAAHHVGMQVLGISCITNMAAGISPVKLTEGEVLEVAARVHDQFAAVVRGVICRLPEKTGMVVT
ncbi:MAG: purine-nucleoside phosphorylase [Chloroflexota bacterium]|nr:MAG: purine-nucleoside phosphorylase [Chloroflexota bacterium]